MKNVLVVDDEKYFILSLSQGLSSYKDKFKLLTAANGKYAIETLKENKIDLLVTDLKMPEVDGFALIAHVSKNYPSLPIIVMTAFATPEMEKRIKRMGNFTFLEKPLDYDMLVNKIFESLEKAEKGHIKGISLAAFIQLVNMEQKSCTLTVWHNQQLGHLYFIEGQLIDAESADLQGLEAAYKILGWEEAEIEFVNVCTRTEKVITQPLEYVLLESYRIKDEEIQKQKEKQEPNNTINIEEDKIMSLQDTLVKFKELNGFIGVGLFSSEGELLATGEDSAMEMDMVGALVNNMVMNAHKASQELGLGGSSEMDIVTSEGANIYVRCHHSDTGLSFTLILICTLDTQRGMVRLRLNQAMPELVGSL